MKKTLNNAGVNEFQSELFQLTLTEQQFLIAQIRADFPLFMSTYFDLHMNQIAQINSMTPSFITTLVEGIATTWEAQLHVSFNKETTVAQDKPGVKDIILASAPPADPNNTSANSIVFPFTIWIRYRNIAT